MDFDYSLIDKYFPFDEFRDGQREAIEYALDAFSEGKRIFILEAPTGSGKSPIGICLSRFFQRSYYITIQKILQSQIIEDFGGDEVVDLRGRANYPCDFYDREGEKLLKRKAISEAHLKKAMSKQSSCNEGYCRKTQKLFKCQSCFTKRDVSDGSGGTRSWGYLKQLPSGMTYSACPYYERVFECINAPVSLFNFSSFLYQTSMTKGRFGQRDLVIVDECHNTEPQLLNFVELKFNDRLLGEYHYQLKEYDTPPEYWLDFEENSLYDIIGLIITNAQSQDNLKLQDEYAALLRRLVSFRNAISSEEEWVCEFKDYGDYREIKLKPVFVHNRAYSHVLDYGKKALLMSATILDVDVFCRSLGIDRSEVAAYRMKNRFPVKNRPIYIHAHAKIRGGQKKQKEWGPKLVKAADEVIKKYPDEKGIIHTHNFNIARMLLTDSKHNKRMLFQINFKNKEQMLRVHAESQNSIIVAPAMHEGLDLKGDLSRFQIIAKVPYPNFMDDKQLARRVELDRKYYDWLVALKLVQSYGRSVRDDEDYADTFVIDEVFRTFVSYNKGMLPTWFLKAIDYDYQMV